MTPAESNPVKHRIKNILKLILTAGAILYLWKSGILSTVSLKKSLSHPASLLIAFALMGITQVLAAYRWMRFLRQIQPTTSLAQALKYHFIGLFFSSVLPGVVSGDVIKAIYVAKDLKRPRMDIFSTVIIDRLFGLTGVILLAGLGSLISFSSILTTPLTSDKFLWSIAILNTGVLCGLIFLYHPYLLPRLLSRYNPTKLQDETLPENKTILARFIRLAFFIQRLCPPQFWIFKQGLLSIGIHILVTASCFFFHRSMLGDAPVDPYLFFSFLAVTPMGLLVAAIPILPGGLGTGHASFEAFYKLIGLESGAEVFTILFVTQVLYGLLGGLYYFVLLARGVLKPPTNVTIHNMDS